MTRDELIRLENLYGANLFETFEVVIARAKGVWAWDTEGGRYLDCVSAYGALNHGHCHPKIHRSFLEQADRVSVLSRAFHNDQVGPFYKELCDLTGSRKALLVNSDSQAVDIALRAVRAWGSARSKIPESHAEIIVCDGGRHGRATPAAGHGAAVPRRGGVGGLPHSVVTIPFGDAKALQAAIGANTTGFLVEPIQAERAINVPPDGYLRAVRKICSDRGIALIIDETQTGLGRTGKMLAEEHEAVRADLSIVGKSLGGGFVPLSALLARGELLDAPAPGVDHRSTYGAHPLACAVGRAALRVLVEENLVANAAKMGAHLRAEIEAMGSSWVSGVRGKGMLLGIELTPHAPRAPELCRRLVEAGLLCTAIDDGVIRFCPPIIMDDEEAGWALERLGSVLKS